jgi:hypothetical protein
MLVEEQRTNDKNFLCDSHNTKRCACASRSIKCGTNLISDGIQVTDISTNMSPT